MKWERPIKLILYGGFLGGYAMMFASMQYGLPSFPYGGGGNWLLHDNWRPLFFGGVAGMVSGLVDRSYRKSIISGLVTSLTVVIGHYVHVAICLMLGEAIFIFMYPVWALTFSLGLVSGNALTILLIYRQKTSSWSILRDSCNAAWITLVLTITLEYSFRHVLWSLSGESAHGYAILEGFIYGFSVVAAFYIVRSGQDSK